MNIFQSAKNNWPEDEAAQIADFWGDEDSRKEYEKEDWENNVFRDCQRMEKFFLDESDGAELVKRFRTAIIEKLNLPEDFFK